jgi:hypothetical protein
MAMSGYLWDGKGAPDPDVVELEQRLAPLRFGGEWVAVRSELERRSGRPYGAIAASIAIGALAFSLLGIPKPQFTEWAVTELHGDVRMGRDRAAVSSRMRPGQSVITGAAARVRLANEDFGEVNLSPASALRMIHSADGRDVMSLERGRLHAFIWAPPRQFVVETPSSRTIDLGCEYTLTVDARGDGLVEVELGWVAFQFGPQESFIPAGAACRTTRRSGPGIPFFVDAEPAFREALEQYESAGGPAALQRVLAFARAADGLTLWHLLTRVPVERRSAVFDRFAELINLPDGVERSKALAKDAHTLDLCWNALGLDDAGWWREWKHEWKAR